MNDVNYVKNELFIDRKKIEFIFTILKILKTDDVIIILLDSPPKSFFNRNIFGVDYSGNILWQIEEPNHVKNTDNSFTDIWFDDKSKDIKCYNWFGDSFSIDLKKGSLLKAKFVR